MVVINTDETVTRVHMVRLNKQEANLVARPENCLDLSFLDVFGSILISYINGNS